MALQITISEEKEIVILKFVGKIDSFSIDELNSGFDTVMKTGRKNILLVMKDLEYINSRGIGALLSFLKWVKKVGGLVKIAEVPINIMQVLNLLGLDGLTLIYDSSSDAIVSFRRQQFREKRTEESVTSEIEDYTGRPAPSKGNRMPYIILGAVFLILIVIFLFLFNNTALRGSTGVDLRPIEGRLENLEERLLRLDIQGKEFPQLIKRMDGFKKSVSGRIDQLAKEVDSFKRELESENRRLVTGAPVEEETATRPVIRYHKVRSGESLYRIGLRYGTSVARLCRLNNIDRNKHIYPGQKLIVGSPESEQGEIR